MIILIIHAKQILVGVRIIAEEVRKCYIYSKNDAFNTSFADQTTDDTILQQSGINKYNKKGISV